MSAAGNSSSDSRQGPPPLNRLARGLKLLGRLTSPETPTGERFVKLEKRLTALSEKLALDPRWLRVTGELLRQVALLRMRRHGAIESLLRALRIPTASEVATVHEQLHQMSDQVEALSTQIELVVELLEQQRRAQKSDEST
jgi:hypothetical protein